MDEKIPSERKQLAGCIRQFLSGHVSCDHLTEEFKSSDNSDIREIIDLIEKETVNIDKYERLDRSESEFKESMERLIKKLEES